MTVNVPINIAVRFGDTTVVLLDHHSQVTTDDGVVIGMREEPRSWFRPTVVHLPSDVAEKYRGQTPRVTDVTWVPTSSRPTANQADVA